MTGLGHPEDDRLLELAYGELGAPESRALRQHVDGCTRCRELLAGIAEVRSAVRRVPPEPAPERGLESLLAYGEQAAARARSHRRNVQWLGLLTLATAAGLAWVLVPERRAPPSSASEAVARADAPTPPAQGDRLAEAPGASAEKKMVEQPKAKDAEEALLEAKRDRLAQLGRLLKRPPAPGGTEPVMQDLSRDEARRKEALARADAPRSTDALEREAPAPETAKKAESTQKPADPNEGLWARTSGGSPAKLATAKPAAPTPPATSAPLGQAGASGVARELGKGSTAGPADVASSTTGGRLGGVGVIGGVAADKADGAFVQAGSGAKEAQNRAASAAPAAVGTLGSDRASQLARLIEVHRSVTAATGDARKALLLEQCRLEASLELRASVVGTCSQVAREFPGTKEAQQAVELARGFSVQLPSP